MKNWIKKELEDYKILLRSVPAYTVTLFVLSVVCMNLLANKELFNIQRAGKTLLAMDCGFTISWISFLCMDCICKRWGPKAATKISILAIVTNLGVTLLFRLLSLAPGFWGEAYGDYPPEIVNDVINNTFAGNWRIVIGSATAMLLSSIVNSILNHTIGKATHDDGSFKKFAIRSFVSTGLAQWVDNMFFAFALWTLIFPDWTFTSILINATIGALLELACEIFLSPIGYKMSKGWQAEGVGQAYLDLQKS